VGLLALCGCPNELELRRKSETRYRIAEDAYARGDYGTAVLELERALDLNKKNAEAHYLMGLFWMRQRGDLMKAEKEFKAAIEYHDGPYSMAKNALGNVYLVLERCDEAIPLFNEALDDIHYYKDSWAAEINLGRCLFMKGDLDGAISHLDRGVTINPHNCSGFMWRGDVWEKKGDHEKAAADYAHSTAESACKTFTDGWERLGKVDLTLGKKVEAAQAFAACAASAPGTGPGESCAKLLKTLCMDEAVIAAALPACAHK
jgi:tetratricopeptide (TPR) repeat protein